MVQETIQLIKLDDLASRLINHSKGEAYSPRALSNWAKRLDLIVRDGMINELGAKLLWQYYEKVACVNGKAQLKAQGDFVLANSEEIARANSLMADPTRYANSSTNSSTNSSATLHEEYEEENQEELEDSALSVIDSGLMVLQAQTDLAIDSYNQGVDEAADRFVDAVQGTQSRFLRRFKQRAEELKGKKAIDMSGLLSSSTRQLPGGADGQQ